MLTNSLNTWSVRLGTLALWAVAGASVVYWLLRVTAPAGGDVALPVATSAAVVDAQSVARALGVEGQAVASAAPVAAAESRFALLGVLAGRHSGGGAALIAVDGQPAKTFRVGAAVTEGFVLHSLSARQAQLAKSQGGEVVTLEMPLKKM